MPLDPTIPLQVQTPNPAATIGQWGQLGLMSGQMGLQRGQQQLQNIQLQREQATLQPTIQQAQAQARTATAGAQSAETGVQTQQAMIGWQQLASLVSDPDVIQGKNADVIASKVQAARDRAIDGGMPRQMADVIFNRAIADAHTEPQNFRQQLLTLQQGAISPATQTGIQNPPLTPINTGTATVGAQFGNPALTGQPSGAVPGNPVQHQLGAQGAATGAVNIAQAHQAQVIADATAAPNRISQIQTIMQEAPTAKTAMGPNDWLRRVVGAIYTATGGQNEAQTALDVMAKNAAQVALSAGATDAAKALGEMGTPGYRMTVDAVQKTGKQLIGMFQKQQVAGKVFAGMAQDDPNYQQKAVQWSTGADPRLFEPGAPLEPNAQNRPGTPAYEQWKQGYDLQTRSQLGKKLRILQPMIPQEAPQGQ